MKLMCLICIRLVLNCFFLQIVPPLHWRDPQALALCCASWRRRSINIVPRKRERLVVRCVLAPVRAKRRNMPPTTYSRGRISGEHFETKVVKTWWSQKHAAADLGVKKGTVSACIVRGRGLCQGWRLRRFVEEEDRAVRCPAQVVDDLDDDAGTPNLTKVARVLANLSASPHAHAQIAKPIPTRRPFSIVDF